MRSAKQPTTGALRSEHVAERKQVAVTLRDSEEFYRILFEGAAEGIMVVDIESRALLFSNPVMCAMLGYTARELRRMRVDDIHPTDDLEWVQAEFTAQAHGKPLASAIPCLCKDGSTFYADIHSTPLVIDGRMCNVGFFTDITERRRAEAANARLAAVVASSDDAILSKTPDGMIVTWNQGAERLYGYTAAEIVGKSESVLLPRGSKDQLTELLGNIHDGVAVEHYETVRVRKDGSMVEVSLSISPIYDAAGVITGAATIARDISESKRSQRDIAVAARQWRETLDAMGDSVALLDSDSRVLRCNAATTVLTGRSFEEITGHPCFEVFHGTHDYQQSCPQRRALKSGQTETSILEQDGKWLRLSFTPQLDAAGAVVGGVHVVADVTEFIQVRYDLEQSIARQRRVTDGVIATLARSTEVRDPYTAGHQRRVSELATAIAQEQGYDAEGMQLIRVAGMLHDIGKMVVPAEILAKPTRLTEAEFALIKVHPQAGFDVLEPIEFGSPIADIVLQHHERLDGSGYPQGLRGEEILVEARILAVADVVEAMSSHRPYRAALGVDAALEEIKKNRGKLYEPGVVDACVALFRKKSFAFD